MKTIEINLYTPKELFEGVADMIKIIARATYYWNKTRKIRKPYNITMRTRSRTIQRRMSNEDKEKFVACFPEDLKDKAYFVAYGKFRTTVPPGEFR
jgi:uncharacterized protein (DUF2344 family)